MNAAAFTPESLWFLCLLLFVDGATIAATSTVLVLTYGRYHPAWLLAITGAFASALGGGVQLAILKWALHTKQPWMHRFAPSRERIEPDRVTHPGRDQLERRVVDRRGARHDEHHERRR